MSIQFAKDEKVLKSFNYAAVGYNKKKDKYETFKALTVTNKRIIHEAVRETRGNELILRQEMPVTDAKYIKTAMGKTATPSLLLQAILFAIIAVAAIVVSFLDFAEKFKNDIVHIHISDHTENADCMPPGKGKFDFNEDRGRYALTSCINYKKGMMWHNMVFRKSHIKKIEVVSHEKL